MLIIKSAIMATVILPDIVHGVAVQIATQILLTDIIKKDHILVPIITE
jgi:hypothetical protein